MKKPMSQYLRSGVLAAAAALLAGSPANAGRVVCGNYQPGFLAYISQAGSVRAAPACAVYQGDYMVNQGPVYSGPAVIAPQATYAAAPSAAGYPYVHGKYQAHPKPAVQAESVRKPVARPALVKRVVKRTVAKSTVAKRRVVKVKNDLPPRKGKPQIVHARAEVRIYSPQRMEIRLYRR